MNTTDELLAMPRLGRYRVDADASTITFRTRHVFGLLPVRGSFAIRGGTIDVAEPVSESSVHVEVDADSFHTGNARRDHEVRSATYLHADQHPVITFTARGPVESSVDGTLTVCGVAQPVRLTVHDASVAANSFTARATTRIDRTEFGLTAGRGITGRYLDLELDITCVRR